MQKERTFWQDQLAQVCSQIVYFLFFFKVCIFVENAIKIGVSAKTPRKKKKKT